MPLASSRCSTTGYLPELPKQLEGEPKPESQVSHATRRVPGSVHGRASLKRTWQASGIGALVFKTRSNDKVAAWRRRRYGALPILRDDAISAAYGVSAAIGWVSRKMRNNRAE